MMKARLLLVDDEEHFIQPLSERLSMRNYDVTIAMSGEEAIEKLNRYNYDVVILDVDMKGMNGIETLKEIKVIKPLTEVIMLTGHGTVKSAVEGMKLGAIDYLLKPSELDELIEKIDRAYDEKCKVEERMREDKMKDALSSPRSVIR
jgi:DNA-binding NtrC family response regulator